MLGLQVLFFCVCVIPLLLPTVTDPSSLTELVHFPFFFFFFFFTLINTCSLFLSCNSDYLPSEVISGLLFFFSLSFISNLELKLYKKGLMSANTISALFFLCTGEAVGKETVVFCAGTCLCNISEFLCLPHCCRFSSASTRFTQRCQRDAKPSY